MADNLSTMFKRATIGNKDDELYVDELYQRGYRAEQIEFIIRTANYLLDNYPNNYRKKLHAINAAIDILIQNQVR